MNPIIEELITKADLTEIIDDAYLDRNDWQPYVEKFVKLIIKECAYRIDYWEARQGEHCEDLLEHFGVK